MDARHADDGFDWARRFDDAAKEIVLDDPTTAARLDGHRDFRTAVPTPDHFLPLLYFAGLAGAGGSRPEVLVDGYAYGSLSMTAYTSGGTSPAPPEGGAHDAAAPPLPDGVPADSSNI
jgi:4,5-DOPA dioxygenase extradiol